MYKIIAWILLGAVLALSAEILYQNKVIQNQRTTIEFLFYTCEGQDQ